MLWLCCEQLAQLRVSGSVFWSTCFLSCAGLEEPWSRGSGIPKHCSHPRGTPSPGKDEQAVNWCAAVGVSEALEQS